MVLTPLRLLSLLLPFAAVTAQTRLLVVDAMNRPGTDFTSLPAAVAAALPGDVLQVRADGGGYESFSTSLGITICATGGQGVLRTDNNGPVTVAGLPAGQQFTLRGFLVGPRNTTGPIVRVANCAGRVVLHSLEIGLGFPSVDVQASSAVLLQEGRIFGGFPSVAAQGSTLQFAGLVLQGGAGDDRFQQPSAPAVALGQSRAVFAGCGVTGGIGRGAVPPSPALELVNSAADFGATGGFGSLRAGAPGLLGAGTAPAVGGSNASLRLDPAVVVTATGAVAPIVGVTATAASFPSLRAETASRVAGSLWAADVPGAAQVLVIGLPAGPIAVPGVAGSLWLDPNAMFVVPFVPQFLFQPNVAFGRVLAGQVAALTTTGVELSNVAMMVVR